MFREGSIEFLDIARMVFSVVNAHCLLIDGRNECVIWKAQVGEGKPRRIGLGGGFNAIGCTPTTEERGNQWCCDCASAGETSNFEKGAFVHGVGFMATNWVASVIIKPLLFTLVQRRPVDREAGA